MRTLRAHSALKAGPGMLNDEPGAPYKSKSKEMLKKDVACEKDTGINLKEFPMANVGELKSHTKKPP